MELTPTCRRGLRVGILLGALTLPIGGAGAIGRAQGSPEQDVEEQPDEQSSEETEPPAFEERIHVEGAVDAVPTFESTFAKIPTPLQSTPASVSVVPRFVIESQDANILGEALQNVSGVNVGTGFGVFDFFVIRGFDSLDTSLVMTDGAFEPESTFYNLYNIDRVEVLKGPIAFLYGGNPLSGTVTWSVKSPAPATLPTSGSGSDRSGPIKVRPISMWLVRTDAPPFVSTRSTRHRMSIVTTRPTSCSR